jgi:hypothetical protein
VPTTLLTPNCLRVTRHSFDIAWGLIYQLLVVHSLPKGGNGDRALAIPGITVIHKHIGESKIRGIEVHADLSLIAGAIQEAASKVSK